MGNSKPKLNQKTCHLCNFEKYENKKIKKDTSLNKRKKDSNLVSTTKTCI